MANEEKKDFNAMLHDSKDMPKLQIITDKKSIEKYYGDRMLLILQSLLRRAFSYPLLPGQAIREKGMSLFKEEGRIYDIM